MLPFVYRVTKYDPADRNEHGGYMGAEDMLSDHGPVEAAYLQAVAAFVEDSGIDHLVIREPSIAGFVSFGLEPPVDGHGLAGLFPPDLAGFHDGALVSVAVGLELIRVMLRDNGAWCRLEVEGVFAAHVGFDQYVYVGSSKPCDRALARAHALGLFPERWDTSPIDAHYDEEPGLQRPADEDFWARLRWSVSTGRDAILQEGFVDNASRWHRLTRDTLDAVRASLTPRAKLTVWPDLSTDVGTVLAALPDEGAVEIVWENENGQITGIVADDTQFPELIADVAGARAAMALPLDLDNRNPLFTAVLPDSDGVLRARWRTEPTPGDRDWAFLKTLRCGRTITGTVTEIADVGVTFVDIDGFAAMINIPELSWKRFDYPCEVVEVGQVVTAEILDVDMVRERVSLSLKALEDCWLHFPYRVGQIIPARVTKLVAFGVFANITDGLETLIHISELTDDSSANPGQVVQVGDVITVKILDIDREQRRITLSHKQAVAAGTGEDRLA